MLDGEILDKRGNSQFRSLLFRRGESRFYAFDLLSCNGKDLSYPPLTDRKHRLRGVVPHEAERLLYCDHLRERGEHLFRLACKRDLEGIVAKRKLIPTRSTTRNGTRSEIKSIHTGLDEKNCSNGSGEAIPNGICGMLALWSRTKSPNQIRKKNPQLKGAQALLQGTDSAETEEVRKEN